MTDAGSTWLFRMNRLKFCRGRGEVYSGLRGLHAQVAKMLSEDELSWTVPVAEVARDGLKGRYDDAPTSNAARVWQRVCRDTQAECAASPLKRTYPKLFFCSLGPEMENFCPGIETLLPGQLRREWTMLVFNEGVIEHRGTIARAFHAGRVIHAGICVRKTESRANYSAKILEENGDLWNQV